MVSETISKVTIYRIKADGMLFQMQKPLFCFGKWIVLCKTLNLNPGEISHIGCKICGV